MKRSSGSTNQTGRIRQSATNVHRYFKQYCDSTSIHGFRYFGEKRLTFEKVWWTIIFVLCLSGCSIMIYKIYEKYDTNPVIVTFATEETPIYKIPFPAVTICPEIKYGKSRLDLKSIYNKKIQQMNLTKEDQQYLEHASLMCDEEFLDGLEYDNSSKTFDNEFFKTLDQIKPEFMKQVFRCEFLGQDFNNCAEILTPVLTDEGVCYSLNILDRGHIFNDLVYHYKEYHKVLNDTHSWNMENGYLDEDVLSYPLRALLPGATNGLILYLGTKNEDIDYLCKDIQGFKVILHSPVRIPRLKQEYFRVPLNQAVVAAVQPVLITTSKAVKTFDVKKRKCQFPSERKLKYFRSYSQQNCLLECLTNITLQLCGCVNSFMPKYNNTLICGLGNNHCLRNAEEILQIGELAANFDGLRDFKGCECLPLCTDLSYNVETSQTQWDRQGVMSGNLKLPGKPSDMHLSSLTIYFKFNHFIASERQELYGATDFIANFGGLLGLFTGFSILSLMEIIYFLTIRICCNIHLFGRWVGAN